ncbi:MAG TPA: DsbA family protein [Stellaceae bacterium]|jgi:protein-disulfide isomerase|nr:DsbA family protein [Stellaceae bacterium]
MSLRFLVAPVLLAAVFAVAAPRLAAADEFSPSQKKEIEGIVGAYLKAHPEVLIDAIQAADDKLKADAKDKAGQALAAHKQQVFDDPQSPVAGNPKGDVTLVEFFDYRCPYCKQVEPSLEKLIGEDRQLKFVYKEFPVLGPDSEIAARVALAAKKQGKYDAFHRAMMNTQGHIDEAVIYKVAASAGLDVDRAKRDMNAPDIEQELKGNLDLGKTLELDGTPSFIVGDTIVPGAIGIGDLKQLVATARKK